MINPAGIYLLKVNNRNTITKCEICSKLTIKTPERRQMRRLYNCHIIKANKKKVRVRLEAGKMMNRSLSGNSFW